MVHIPTTHRHPGVLTRFGWLVFMSALPPNEWLLKEQLNNNEPRPCSDHFSHLPEWAHEVSLNYSSPQKIMKGISISLFRNIRQSWFFPWPYWALWDGNGHDLQCSGENTSPRKRFAVYFETLETCFTVALLQSVTTFQHFWQPQSSIQSKLKIIEYQV